MARRKLTDKLIDKFEIKEELGIIEESNVDLWQKREKSIVIMEMINFYLKVFSKTNIMDTIM